MLRKIRKKGQKRELVDRDMKQIKIKNYFIIIFFLRDILTHLRYEGRKTLNKNNNNKLGLDLQKERAFLTVNRS